MGRRYAGLILALAVCAGVSVWLWLEVRQTSREFARGRQELNQLISERTNLFQIKREYERTVASRQSVESVFLSSSRAVDFIVFLENLARSSGNAVEVQSVRGEGEAGGNQLDFKMALAGNYPNLVNFLAQLENSPYLTQVSRLETSRSVDSETRASILRTNADIRVLTLEEENQVTK
ncbi:MAG: hypothetical protein HY454_02690 [Parcubacteria group bacterium]|nr:hypothetical protein [Parcubacteria group bacterium]